MKRGVWGIFKTAIILGFFVVTTQAQPVLVKEISPNSTDFAAVGDLIYYVAGDSLFRSDGTTTGTIFLKAGLHRPSTFTAFKDLLFFVSRSNFRGYQELWRSDGTPSGTYILNTSANFDTNILATAGNYLYFSASDGTTGKEIYRTDGSLSGTWMLKDINPGTVSSSVGQFTAVGNVLFFSADDGSHGVELWKTDGSSSGTVMVKDINPGAAHGIGEGIPAAYDNKLYFSGITSAAGAEAWVSDGTAAGTVLLKDLTPGASSAGFIEYTAEHDGWLYFFASPPRQFTSTDVVVDLWKSGGTTASTTKIASLSRCSSCDYIGDYNIYNNKLYFFLNVDQGREVLWATDGTPQGTAEIFSLPTHGPIPFFQEVNGYLLFFGANDYDATPFYRSDGTSGGTEIFMSFNSSGHEAARNIQNISIATIDDQLYFADHDGPANSGYPSEQEDFYQLMRSDGFETQSFRTLGGGSYAGSDDATNVDGKLIFTTHNYFFSETDRRKRLWIYDPAQPFQSRGVFTLVDADTNDDIQTLNEGDVVTRSSGVNFNVRYDPPGEVARVVFRHQDRNVRRESAAPYSLAGDSNGDYFVWSDGVAGSHKIEAIPYTETEGTETAGQPLVVNFTIQNESTNCSSSGSILREYWTGVSGSQVSNIPVNTEPTGTSQLTTFEGPTNTGVNYGARIRGYVCAPMTGDYTFWIASNDHSELWLSTDDNPANKQRIAYVTGATNPREWEKFSSQKSAPVRLTAGTRYYIEALHKQGAGTDHVAVGWQLPNGIMARPIQGFRLSPFSGELIPEVTIDHPLDGRTFMTPVNIEISGTLSGFRGTSPSVDLFAGSMRIGTAYSNNGSYAFNWTNVEAGAYKLTAVARDYTGASDTSAVVNIIVENPCTALGRITREHWSDVQGSRVSDIPLDSPPSGVTELTLFETESSGTNYGARIRGFICPPSSGSYVFWISSNDHSELWLSTDEDPANKTRIAYVSRATNLRQWDKFSTQQSSPVLLTQGKKYYIEALHKQGVGSDHLSVGWQAPNEGLERPIPGSRLSPYPEDGGQESYIISPTDQSGEVDPLVLKLETKRIVGASMYTVELSEQDDFSGPAIILNSAEDHQNNFIVKNLESGTTYYARVKSDVSGFGPVTTFITREEIPMLRLWGITTAGGAHELGTIFSYSIDDDSFVKHVDQEPYPYEDYWVEENLMGTLIPAPDGNFYGHVDHDYSSRVFTLSPQGNVEWWSGGAYFYEGKLFLASNNDIYATNRDEMVPGVIDRYDVEEQGLMLESRMEFFEETGNGGDPGAPLIELANGYMYGTAGSGGMNDGGVIYRFRHDGSGFEVVHYFDEVGSGIGPYSGLTEYNGFLYGATLYGGEEGNRGTIFRIRRDGTEFTKLHDFNGINGAHPEAELTVMENVLYGTTNEGGASDAGTVFRINPDGSGFTLLHSFSGADGSRPSRGVVHDRSGNLYGMTTYGGTNGVGVIYSVNSTGSDFEKLFDFSNASGGTPNGILVIREDTYMPAASFASSIETQQARVSVNIHPNPSTDSFNVMVSSPGTDPIHMVLTDQNGQEITTYNITRDVQMQLGSGLKRGIYIMKIIQGREITMQRIVKK